MTLKLLLSMSCCWDAPLLDKKPEGLLKEYFPVCLCVRLYVHLMVVVYNIGKLVDPYLTSICWEEGNEYIHKTRKSVERILL
ncbi:unnamed protein product [Phytomonas sp. Hart1]|nr:unnamed protein product [Phytomonas sp. Hart1]|eukprot:CCW72340.1 unnamed protein product [Phytomonas sp. isolate Hart1]